MTLREYYRGLTREVPPKTRLVKAIMRECGVEMSTVRKWLSGESIPSNQAHVDRISELTGIPTEELFERRTGDGR